MRRFKPILSLLIAAAAGLAQAQYSAPQGPAGPQGEQGETGATGPAGPVTNQVVTYAGVVYTITNDPSAEGDVLYFDPATSNAYFGAAAAGLSIDEVRAAEPLATNSTEVAIGGGANGATDGAALGYTANGSSSGSAVGRNANGSSSGSAVGRNANGSTYGGAVGQNADGKTYGAAIGYGSQGFSYGAAIGYSANGSSYGAAIGHNALAQYYGSALGAYANGTGTNIAIGAYSTAIGGPNRTAIGYMTTNPVNNSTRVRGDLYLDGGSNVFVRPAFGSGEFTPLATGGAGGDLSNRVVALESPYQAWTVLDPGEGETCTIAIAHGSLVSITATNGLTTIEFDNTGYGTQGVSRVGVELWAGTNSIAFNDASITNPTAPTISTNAWNSLFFRRTADNALWEGRQ